MKIHFKYYQAFTTKSYRKIPLHSCAYSSKHNFVAVGSAKGVIEVFDVRNIKYLLCPISNNIIYKCYL